MKHIFQITLFLLLILATSCSEKKTKKTNYAVNISKHSQFIHADMISMFSNTNNSLYLLSLDERIASVTESIGSKGFGTHKMDREQSWEITIAENVSPEDLAIIKSTLIGLCKQYDWSNSQRKHYDYNYNYRYVFSYEANIIKLTVSCVYNIDGHN